MEVVTLKFNHGGRFLNSSNGLLYVGGRSNTFDAEPTTSGPTVLNTAMVMSSAPQPSTQGYNL